MKTRVFILAAAFALLTAGSACAAPLDDYSKAGNVGIGVYTMRTNMKDDRESTHDFFNRTFDYGNKWNWGGELTVSFAPKWALSLDYLSSKNREYMFYSNMPDDSYMSSKLKSANIKLKYQAYRDGKLFVAPYLGVASNKLKQTARDDASRNGYGVAEFAFNTKRKTSLLAGVTLVYGIDKDQRFKAYFDGAVGSSMYSWNMGLSCEVAKNLDFDFGYRYYRSKLNYGYADTAIVDSSGQAIIVAGNSGKINSTSKGIYVGLSYKFK